MGNRFEALFVLNINLSMNIGSGRKLSTFEPLLKNSSYRLCLIRLSLFLLRISC